MKRYYMESVESCQACGGAGWARNPAWAAVDAYADGLTLRGEERSTAIERFASEQFGTDNPRRWPPEEVGCGECDGEGEIRRKEDVTELFGRLLQSSGDGRRPFDTHLIKGELDD